MSMSARRLHWLVPLALLAVSGTIYLPALPRDFTFDSQEIVRDNAQLAPGSSPLALWFNTYWGQASGREYRPVTLATFWVEKNVLGFTQARSFAIVNALLHAAVAWLLWLLVRRWTGTALAAGVAAALFVTHPIATEAVPNLVGRADLLAAGFGLAALLAWERRGEAHAWAWTALAAALWLLGLLSKESVAVLPIVAALRDVQRFGRRTPWLTWCVWPIVGVAWLAWRAAVLGEAVPLLTNEQLINPLTEATPVERGLTAVAVWARYVRLMVWPQWMSAEYAYDQIPVVGSPLDAWFVLGLVLLAACVAAIAYTWRRRPIIAIGLTLTLAAWLLVSNIPIVIGTIMADRLMYLPLAGACAALGAIAGAAQRPIVVIGVASVCAAALGVRSGLRATVWRDEPTLWKQTAQDAPRNARALVSYAKIIMPTDIDAAETLMRRAMDLAMPLDPAQSLPIANNLGTLYLQRASQSRDDPPRTRAYLDEAERWFNHALAGEAPEGRHYERWLALRRWQQSHGHAVSQTYGEWELHLNLASLALMRDDADRAVAELRTALAIDPDNVLVHERLADLLRKQDRPRDAAEALRALLALQPEARARWIELATLESSLGDLDAALDAADRATALRDDGAATKLLMEIYHTALNTAAEAKDAARMRAIAQRAAERHRIRIDLPADLEAQLNATPPPPSDE